MPIDFSPHMAVAQYRDMPMVDEIRSHLRLRAHVAVGRCILLDDQHSSEIPRRVIGNELRILGGNIRTLNVHQGGHIGLPSSKLIYRRQISRGKQQWLQCRRSRLPFFSCCCLPWETTALTMRRCSFLASHAIFGFDSVGCNSFFAPKVRQCGLSRARPSNTLAALAAFRLRLTAGYSSSISLLPVNVQAISSRDCGIFQHIQDLAAFQCQNTLTR